MPEYNVVNGTSYHAKTPAAVIDVLERARQNRTGGGAMLDHCIVRIRSSEGGGILYQHPAYHFGNLSIRRKTEPVTPPDGRTLKIDVIRDGQPQAAFETVEKARRWVHKLGVVAPISA